MKKFLSRFLKIDWISIMIGLAVLFNCSKDSSIPVNSLTIQHPLVREYFISNSLNPDNLRVSSIRVDKQTNMHVKLEKFWNGIYLWDLGLKVKFDASGKALETEGLFPPVNLSISTDTLARSAAFEMGKNFLEKQELSVPLSSIDLEAEFVIWAMNTFGKEPEFKSAWYVYRKPLLEDEKKIQNRIKAPNPKISVHEPNTSEVYWKHGNWAPYVVFDAKSGSMLVCHTGLKRLIGDQMDTNQLK